MRLILVLATTALLLAAGCTDLGGCVSSRECRDTHACVNGVCILESDDAAEPGPDAASPADAANADDGAVDGQNVDSGPDGAAPDAGGDAPVDAGDDVPLLDAGDDVAIMDVGDDVPPDAGCMDPTWGLPDDDTSDVAGDDFGIQTWTLNLCEVPALGQQMTLRARARITRPGIEFMYDIFASYIYVNDVGGSRDTLTTWEYVVVTGATFSEYTVLLPADIDGDGTVDWVVGENELRIRTWSGYNARPGKTGVDSLVLEGP